MRTPESSGAQGERARLWMTPREWLAELPIPGSTALRGELERGLSERLSAITDVSDALVEFDVSGERSSRLLAKTCSLDLRPERFAPGCVARSLMADVRAVLWTPLSLEWEHCPACLVRQISTSVKLYR